MRLTDLRDALAAADDGWLRETEDAVRRDPAVAARLYAAVPRQLGRGQVAGWPADLAGRAVLLAAVLAGPDGPARLAELYRHGDTSEKLAVLRALPLLPDPGGLPEAAVPLLRDALRTNDTRLVGAALGPYADHLDQDVWRHGVLKCVFSGIPLNVVHRLDERADGELAVMLDGLATERAAAGRALPADAAALLRRLAAAGRD